MVEDESDADAERGDAESEEKSFRERVEEIRQQRAEEGGPDGGPEESPFGPGGGESPFGGGGGMGGNPFAQMMGGMMGGGPSGAGGDVDTERLVRELQGLREQLTDANRQLERIADALEDD